MSNKSGWDVKKSEFLNLPDLHEIYSFKNNNTFILNYKSK